MALDFLMVLIVAIFIFAGYRKGFVRSIYGLLSITISGFVSAVTGNAIAVWIYNTFYRESINDSIDNSVSGATSDIISTTDGILNNLPLSIRNLFSFFKVENNSFITSAQLKTDAIVNDIQNSIMNTVISILQLIVSIAVFIILLILFRLLSKCLTKFFDAPVIRQINSMCGLLFGTLEGIAFCYITILIIRLIFQISGQQLFSAEMIDSSIFFNRIYYSDFLNVISLKVAFRGS